MDIHEKITESNINANDHLINKKETVIINEVVKYVASKKQEARPLLTQKEKLSMQLSFFNDQRSVAEDPKNHIENKLIELISSHDPDAFEYEMLDFLLLLKSTLKTESSISFIDAFITQFPTNIREDKTLKQTTKENKNALQSNQAIDGIAELLQELDKQTRNEKTCEKLYEHYSNVLDNMELLEAYDLNHRRDANAIKEITKSIDALHNEINLVGTKLAELSHDIKQHQTKFNQQFDVDENFNLLKISKKTQGLNTSVLYLNAHGTDNSVPYAIYKGDRNHFLSASNFSKVTLCQNTQTKKWCAIKIQPSYLQQDLTIKHQTPSSFDPFYGDKVQNSKFYSLQSLLEGVELKEHITRRTNPSIENRLNIARQAALSIAKFHEKNYFHRDIKPDNFIWDDVKKEIHLCDFGLAIKRDEQPELIASSKPYLAPEIINAPSAKNAPYSVKSDIYALGVTFEKLFEGINDLPKELTCLMQQMTHPLPEERHGDLTVIAKQLDDLFIQPPNIPANVMKDLPSHMNSQ